ncbi:zinc finger protein 431-like [Peromyscus maniculatus bairdii]|uniref:zinc finger protein 431-like n=1 Tax=Peromyscus maniculatus bairdii TaxID=230844 RepID=UPI003FD23F01
MGSDWQLKWRAVLRSRLVKTTWQPIHCNHKALEEENWTSRAGIIQEREARATVGKNAVTYDDVHIDFIWEEWTLLDPCQKNLYKDVKLDIYRNLTTIGYSWEDHNIEEHCQSSRRYGR